MEDDNIITILPSREEQKKPAIDTQCKRFSVYALRKNSKKFYIILDGKRPAKDVNRQLIIQQTSRSRPSSIDAYRLCAYLNTLDADGIDPLDADLNYIESFLTKVYSYEQKSANVVRGYIQVIEKYYEGMARRHAGLHPSLLRFQKNGIKITGKDSKLTTIHSLRDVFPQKKADLLARSSKYTKWYNPAQIDAISEAFPLVDRCIFLDTVWTGHRIDSALSLRLSDFDPIAQTVYARQTKTGQTHIAWIPAELVRLIQTYIIEDRSIIVERTGSDSDYLFLTRNGKPRTYSAYRSSMKRVEEQLKQSRPELKITALHTHAGRSTFLAGLRSYQLAQRRKGVPTFADADILTLMDWASLDNLKNYDLLTRAFDALPFQTKFFKEQYKHMLDVIGHA